MLPLNNFIFDKKYVFESKNTKNKRRKKTTLFLILLIILTYITILSTIIFWGREESQKTPDVFYKSSPDLIAVFTGGAGRINLAIKLSTSYSQPKIFISGMFSKTTLDHISKLNNLPNDINLNLIETDRWAKNTVENVISIKRFLKRHTNIQNIIIVSHDYHILRIKILINQIIKNKKINFNFVGVQSNYFDFNNIIILHKELLKLIKSFFIVMFW